MKEQQKTRRNALLSTRNRHSLVGSSRRAVDDNYGYERDRCNVGI